MAAWAMADCRLGCDGGQLQAWGQRRPRGWGWGWRPGRRTAWRATTAWTPHRLGVPAERCSGLGLRVIRWGRRRPGRPTGQRLGAAAPEKGESERRG